MSKYIELLVDIQDEYFGVDYKKGDIVKVLENYMYSSKGVNKVIACHGHGAYTYANEGQYKEI